MYKAQGEAILTAGVIVGNLFLTNEGSFIPSPIGGCLISGELIQVLSVFEYRKVGHYVPKRVSHNELDKVTKSRLGKHLRSMWVLVF